MNNLVAIPYYLYPGLKRSMMPQNTLTGILAHVCNRTEVSIIKVRERTRTPNIVEARRLFFLFARQKQHTLVSIGKFMNLDHSTVIYGLKRINDHLTYDEELISLVKVLSKDLKIKIPNTQKLNAMKDLSKNNLGYLMKRDSLSTSEVAARLTDVTGHNFPPHVVEEYVNNKKQPPVSAWPALKELFKMDQIRDFYA